MMNANCPYIKECFTCFISQKMASQKRSASTQLNDGRSIKKTKCGPLDNAKYKLHNIISEEPDKRIYQIQQWLHPGFDKTYISFEVATAQGICRKYLQDDAIHTNVLEYYFGTERCPLVFDIEWVFLPATSIQALSENISGFVDVLLEFLSQAIEHEDGIHITRDDICVEQACSLKKRKASFHVKVPKLVFPNMACDMNSFVFYFCSWMYAHKAELTKRIPEIFFYQTRHAQKAILEYNGNDLDQIKEICEADWAHGTRQYESCGIDTAIYSNGRAFRVAGACKPNKPDELPRFLRPCLVTGWWSGRLDNQHLSEEMLNMDIPPKECRRVWACTSLLMDPAPGAPNIRVSPPRGISWRASQVTDSKHVVLLPPPDNAIEKEWQWVLNTNPYTYPVKQVTMVASSSSSRAVPLDLDVNMEGDGDDGGFIYILGDGKVDYYEKRDGHWYNTADGTECAEISQFKQQAFSRIQDKFARFWNQRKNMQLRSLEHMESSGYDDEKTHEDYTQLREEFEDAKQSSEQISIHYIDDRTQDWMFTASNITIDPCFKLIRVDRVIISFGDIDRKTEVFCPKHEIDHNIKPHSASAFVDINKNGRRFMHCSRCGGPGMSIKETLHNGKDDETWEDLQKQYGDGCVKLIEKDYFTLEDLLRLEDDNDDNASLHSTHSLTHRHSGPKIYIGISRMGTGKTTLLQKLAIDLTVIMRELDLDVMHQPSILSISPRRDLAQFTAQQLGLMNYNDNDGMLQKHHRQYGENTTATRGELLCEQSRLSICLNSLPQIAPRQQPYNIIFLDEFATIALSMISDHMLPHVTETMKLLETLVKKAKIVIMLAADGTPMMAKTLLPFIDWEDPAELHITINNGGIGGITGHELFVSDDRIEVCQVLKLYIQEGKTVYIPTNQKQFADQLVDFCKSLGLRDDEIMFYHSQSSKELKREIIKEPEYRMGLVDGSPYPKVRVFIATPAFGVGFSVRGGLFDVTIAFFFTYPLTVPGNIQHIARIRGVKENTIICYYQSHISKNKFFSSKQGDEQTYLEKAITSYEDLITSLNQEGFCRMPEGQLRSFAIICEARDRLSKKFADSMFIEIVTSSTRTLPHLLKSWICNKGTGPCRIIPDLSDGETDIICSKKTADADENLPTSMTVMRGLWCKQMSGVNMTSNEVEHVKLFEELPIPIGLLLEHERCESFVRILDHIWRAMEVMTTGETTSLLKIDAKKYTLSHGVSMVPQGERYYQQYQLFETWSRLLLPYLPEAYQELQASNPGIELFSYLTNLWQQKNVNDVFHFNLNPQDVDFEDTMEDTRNTINTLRENDADVDEWFDDTKPVSSIAKEYAGIIRRGFRRFLGIDNIKVTTQRNGLVQVKITGLERLILLACVRRIRMECDVVILFSPDKFSVISKFRQCPYLANLVPSDEELAYACGIDL